MGTTESGKKDAQDVTINVSENVLETSASLAKYFQVDARTIRRDLSALQSQDIIRRVGPDRGGHWEIIEQQ
ncbi:MAG: DeoR family transcriptional regulator [Paludibacteraceae bacterium]|nr:DeoR family transcriptional regulator [Paludibacteraceae bacterium]